MRTVGGMVGVAPTAPPHQLATLVAATEAVVMEAATVPPPSYYPPPNSQPVYVNQSQPQGPGPDLCTACLAALCCCCLLDMMI